MLSFQKEKNDTKEWQESMFKKVACRVFKVRIDYLLGVKHKSKLATFGVFLLK